MELESFDDVRKSICKNPNRQFHLLLGNGFSISYDPKIFSYNALHDFITKLNDDDLSKILRVIDTCNFEVIMRYLDTFAMITGELDSDSRLKERVESASVKLKQGLLDAVKEMHPEHVFKVPEEKSKACAQFLQVFLENSGHIYSTNYDLLLYWVLMRNKLNNNVDGFGREIESNSDLTWGRNSDEQNIFYLHGALHLFDTGSTVVKEEYDGNYLLQNINKRMEKDEYPIFVTAGNGEQKLNHIRHNQYLTYCYDKLCQVEGSLVTFGFSFGQNDEHIISAINKAAKKNLSKRLLSIYIGVYSLEDEKHIEHIKESFECKVHVFNAETTKVWG